MQNQLQKAINLAKKTGDRLIVYDMSQKSEAFVVMNLDEYEKMATGRNEVKSLTEDELLDKINRDIAVWKNEQFGKEDALISEKNDSNEFDFISPEFVSESDEDEDFDSEDDFSGAAEFDYSEKENKKNNWGIPSERKVAADEIIDEDTQYLEEVKF
ncbi:MAG: hypothetical protein Q7T50_05775 [Candidatus Magasanikbacteria bacterium]|nr:hypothetical protein [Candidatus Magasanikbacteria bacterium]